MRVSIIGGGTIDDETATIAELVGKAVATRGHTVVCGGLGGVMEAACCGAQTAGGETIGILPTDRLEDANEYVTTPIATGLGHARNPIVVMNGDAVIAIDGTGGTLSEIGFATVFEKPIAGINTHEVPYIHQVSSAAEAVTYIEEAIETTD